MVAPESQLQKSKPPIQVSEPAARADHIARRGPGAAHLLGVLFGPDRLSLAAPGGLALAVLSGAVTSGIGYAIWYSAIPHLGVTTAATVQLTVPALAALLASLLLGEPLTFRLVLSSALILGGVAGAILARGRSQVEH